MTAFLLALIPLAQAIVAHGGINAALGALTFTQMAEIGVQAAGAGPQALGFLKALHPAFETFAAFIEKSGDGYAAAKWFHDSLPQILADNGDEAIKRQQGADNDA